MVVPPSRPMAAKSDPFPRAPLWGAAGLVVFALLAAVFGRMTGAGHAAPPGVATAERSLRFTDRADGAVVVSLAPSGRMLDVITGQNGFLRGTLRGFARTRRADGLGAEPPFILTGYQDGRLILTDPSTGRHVELEAFGSQNEAVFSRLLTMTPPTRTADANMPASVTPSRGTP